MAYMLISLLHSFSDSVLYVLRIESSQQQSLMKFATQKLSACILQFEQIRAKFLPMTNDVHCHFLCFVTLHTRFEDKMRKASVFEAIFVMSSEDRKIIFKLPGWGLALWVLPCPIIGFITCVFLSIVYNFEGSTRTHCGVSSFHNKKVLREAARFVRPGSGYGGRYSPDRMGGG